MDIDAILIIAAMIVVTGFAVLSALPLIARGGPPAAHRKFDKRRL